MLMIKSSFHRVKRGLVSFRPARVISLTQPPSNKVEPGAITQ